MACKIELKENLNKKIDSFKAEANALTFRVARTRVQQINSQYGAKLLNISAKTDRGSNIISVNPGAFNIVLDNFYEIQTQLEDRIDEAVELSDKDQAVLDAEQLIVEDEIRSGRLEQSEDFYQEIYKGYQIADRTQETERDKEIARKLAEKFQKSFNIDNELISPDQATVILETSETPYEGQPAFFYNNKVYIVEGNFNSETVLHEYAHPFIKALYADNSKLFEKIYAQLGTSIIGQDIIENLTREGQLDPGSNRFKEEAIVRGIEYFGKERLNDTVKDDSAFKAFMKSVIYAIKQLMRKLGLGKKLDFKKDFTSTSVKEIADMLLDDVYTVDTSKLEKQAFADFSSQVQDMIKGLKEAESSSIVKSINDIYETAKAETEKFEKKPENYKEFLKTSQGQTYLKQLSSFLGEAVKLNETQKIAEGSQLMNEDFHTRALALAKSMKMFNNFTLQLKKVINGIEETKEHLNSDGIGKLNYFDNTLRTLNSTLQLDLINELGLDRSNMFVKQVSEIQGRMTDLNTKISNLLRESVSNYMVDNADTMNSNLRADLYTDVVKADQDLSEKKVNEFVEKIVNQNKKSQIKKYTKADVIKELGADVKNPEYIAKRVIRYATFAVTKDLLNKVYTGEIADIGAIASNILPYTNINDPVMSFVIGMEKVIDRAAAKSLKEQTIMMEKLKPLLKAFGYNPNKTYQLIDALTSKQKSPSYEDGELKALEVYTLLNEFGNNWRYDYKVLQDALEKAIEESDDLAQIEAREKLEVFEETYMQRPFTNDYYNVRNILRKGGKVYDPTSKKVITVNAATAMEADQERRRAIAAKNINMTEGVRTDDQFTRETTADAAMKNLKLLFTLKDANGQLKTGKELEKTLILRKYRDESKKLWNFGVDYEAVQEDIDNFYEAEIRPLNIDPNDIGGQERINSLIMEHVNKNFVTAYTQEYYNEINNISEKISNILSKSNENPIAKELNLLYEQKREIIGLVREAGTGQPNALNLLPAQIEALKKIEEDIVKVKEKYDTKTGLTKEERKEYNFLSKKVADNKELTDTEQIKYGQYMGKVKTYGLSQADTSMLKVLFEQRASLGEEFATTSYVDVFNSLGETTMDELKGAGELSEDQVPSLTIENADQFINSDVIPLMFTRNERFERWFKKNHYEKTVFEKNEKGKLEAKTVYARIGAWSVTKPKEAKFYETTKIINPSTKQEMIVPGKPSSKYGTVEIKDKYLTIPDFKNNKDKYIGKVIDNKGNFLPKRMDINNPNAIYMDKQYADLKAKDNITFKLLETLKEQYLKLQEGKPYSSKLYLDVPRFRKSGTLEYAQSGENKHINRAKALWKDASSYFSKKKDAPADGSFNFDPDTHLVQANSSGDLTDRVPIQGLYKLDIDEVSPDILAGIATYGYSLNEQQALIENEPLAKALLKTLRDNTAKVNSEISGKAARNKGAMAFIPKGKNNKRAETMEYYVDRLFYGKAQGDFIQANPVLSQVMRGMMGMASFSFIAGDLQSALKQAGGMTFQQMIELAGGKYFNIQSLAQGKLRAAKTMMRLTTKDIYERGAKSLDVQLMEYFNPVEDKTQKDIGRSTSRTVTKDFLDATVLYDARKFLEVKSVYEMAFGMLQHKNIEQIQPNGEVKLIKYADAFEVGPDKVVRLKEGIDPEYSMHNVEYTVKQGDTLESIAKNNLTTVEKIMKYNNISDVSSIKENDVLTIGKAEKFQEMKLQMQGVGQKMNGMVKQMIGPQANKYLTYQLFSFYRKFALPMFLNRFQFDTRKENFGGEVYDWQLGTATRGYYIDALVGMKKAMKGLQYYKKFATEDEKVGIRKVLAEGAYVAMLGLAVGFLFGFDKDDPDRFKKMEKRVDEQGALGWLQNEMLYLTYMVKRENEMFIPVPGVGLDEMLYLVDNTTIATSPTLNLYLKMINDIIYAISGDERLYYSQDVGPYSWQKQGSNKFWNHFMSQFGLKGKNWSPRWAMKKAEAFENTL